jgi:sulfatase maturation enzyme AslB (radical SAM superfamily)
MVHGQNTYAARLERALDPGVRSVDLMLTSRCNQNCAYCLQRRGAREMAERVADAAIRRLLSSRLDRPQLTILGGEPLLAMPLVRHVLESVRARAPSWMKPDVRIVTNGCLLDEETSRLLARHDVFIALSTDGVAPAQDDRGRGSFARIDRLLIRLRRDHPDHFRARFAVLSTMTSRNVPHLAASIAYFFRRGVRDVAIVPVLPDDPGWNARTARELDRQLREIVAVSVTDYRRTGEIPLRILRGVEGGNRDASPCACGSRAALSVDVDGTLAGCSAMVPSMLRAPSPEVRRASKALSGLRVTDRDLPASLDRRERRARRIPMLDRTRPRGSSGSCTGCAAWSTCFVCPIAVASGHGSVPRFHCDVNRLFARHRAAFQREIARLDTDDK